MTAVLLGTDGAVGAPAYSFTNEPTTGLYRVAAGQVGLSILGTQRALVTASALTLTGLAVSTTSTSTATAFIPTGAAVPVNGINLPAANTLGFATNTTQWGTLNATGNWVINAPSSGLGLTINTIANGTLQLGAPPTGTYSGIQSNLTSGTRGLEILVLGATQGGSYGAAQNSSVINAQNGLALSTNDVGRIVINSAGNVTINAPSSGVALAIGGINGQNNATLFEGLNAINAAKSIATYETGTFTGTLTGCTTSPTATFNYSRVGNVVTIDCSAGLTATSNTTACTITGLPAAIQPTRSQAIVITNISDNSVGGLLGYFNVAASGTITLALSATSGTRMQAAPGNFTAAGTKGIGSGLMAVSYNLT
jgi:hypothetical protein